MVVMMMMMMMMMMVMMMMTMMMIMIMMMIMMSADDKVHIAFRERQAHAARAGQEYLSAGPQFCARGLDEALRK